jgi:hypothetical protein
MQNTSVSIIQIYELFSTVIESTLVLWKYYENFWCLISDHYEYGIIHE